MTVPNAVVDAWLAQDPDPVTRRALVELRQRAATDEAAAAELADAFDGTLSFGTAGLRGALGPGPNRMNRVVVMRAAAALAAFLHDHDQPGPPGPPRPHDQPTVAGQRRTVVVGHDARHGSYDFARDSAAVLAGAGFEVLLFDRPVPTPLVPFLVLAQGCAGGVVVTASHNPATDNGYKVYLGDGCQLVSPADSEIAAHIDRLASTPVDQLPRGDAVRLIGDAEAEAYLAAITADLPDGPRKVRWVHTALHGVGSATMVAAAARAGFDAPSQVASQRDPDPGFPTVGFPNPEEPGALDRALALAAELDAQVVIANDPDADRLAVAVPRHGGPGCGGWRQLTGDEVGVLLADDLLRRGVTGTLATTVVSSTMLAEVAAAYGRPVTTTLTGFKWLGRVPGLVFAYEEALGYCCTPAVVRDKDGIAAALRILALVADLAAHGQSLTDRLAELTDRFGAHASDQLSRRLTDRSAAESIMERLRATPPTQLAGQPVTCTDLADGGDDLPPTDALVLTGDSVRVVVRPSGTEPKLKCYLQVRERPGAERGRTRARERLAALRTDVGQLVTP
ncbi:phospho-sugar mutase [Microlunatus sp. Y2014]|uniref:phospho-sugar mutase n=1 Tax=Microlunatus sp. Y2014 TaxID=3418488 RepID=UPI003DA6F2C0